VGKKSGKLWWRLVRSSLRSKDEPIEIGTMGRGDEIRRSTMLRCNDDENKKSTFSSATGLAKGVSCVY